MGRSRIEISVVIPVFNDAGCLAELLRQLMTELEKLGRTYEVILVDDRSVDGSWQLIRRLHTQYPRLRASRLKRNVGQTLATLCGLAHARGELVVTMDDDLQHRPDQLSKLLVPLDEDPDLDCVFAGHEHSQHSLFRRLGSRFVRWIASRRYDLSENQSASSFRAMRASVVREILTHRIWRPAIRTLIYKSTNRIASVPVEHAHRHAGQSNYGPTLLLRTAFDIACGGIGPLRTIETLGFACTACGILLAIYISHADLSGRWEFSVSAGSASILVFVPGFILIALATSAEYLAHIRRRAHGYTGHIEAERIGNFGDSEANVTIPGDWGENSATSPPDPQSRAA